MRLAAVGADALDERRQLVGLAPRDAGDEAFAREAPRDRPAGGVARADDEHGLPVAAVHHSHLLAAASTLSVRRMRAKEGWSGGKTTLTPALSREREREELDSLCSVLSGSPLSTVPGGEGWGEGAPRSRA